MWVKFSMKKTVNSLCAVAIAGFLSACSEPEVPLRRYQEYVVDAPPAMADVVEHAHQDMGDIPMPMQTRPPDAETFTWTTPAGWREAPGMGMRLATLTVERGDETAEATLIVLSGDAGGLGANITRWMEQVNIRPPTGATMDAYIENLPSFTTVGGLDGRLIDFDEFIVAADALSNLIGVIPRGRQTLFIRMSGTQALLAQERDAFLALCKSVQ